MAPNVIKLVRRPRVTPTRFLDVNQGMRFPSVGTIPFRNRYDPRITARALVLLLTSLNLMTLRRILRDVFKVLYKKIITLTHQGQSRFSQRLLVFQHSDIFLVLVLRFRISIPEINTTGFSIHKNAKSCSGISFLPLIVF